MKRIQNYLLIRWGLLEIRGNTSGSFLLDVYRKFVQNSYIRFTHIADSLEKNDGNQYPVQLRVVSVGIHRHRFLVDTVKRRMTNLIQMFLYFEFCPELLRRLGTIE